MSVSLYAYVIGMFGGDGYAGVASDFEDRSGKSPKSLVNRGGATQSCRRRRICREAYQASTKT